MVADGQAALIAASSRYKNSCLIVGSAEVHSYVLLKDMDLSSTGKPLLMKA